MLFRSRLGAIFGVSLAIALFMTFIARPLVVAAILRPFKSPPKQIAVVSWAGLRGAASIVFAIVATVNYSQLEHDLFHMVFCIVLLSIALQGSLLPWLSKYRGDQRQDGGCPLRLYPQTRSDGGQ